MIHVARQPEPAALDRKKESGPNKGKSELDLVLEALEEHLGAGEARNKFSFKFEVYKHDEVKDALEASFHGKCAYCEIFYSANQPMDVEHWRPKGAIQFEAGKKPVGPGYFWLASDWKNLFPSCIDCNRARTQRDVIEREDILLGKANQFPLADEAKRVSDHKRFKRHDDLNDETALLIDPCSDDPETFFVYTEDGAMMPRDDLDDADRARALASIRVYALNRSNLVAERLEVIRRVDHRLGLMDKLEDLRVELEASGRRDLAEVVAQLILAESSALEDMMEASSPFAGLARFLIRSAANHS